jgi:ribonuclease P/MRP protein subunit RPP1
VISGEAKDVLGLRGPWDVVNMAHVWGLGQERGREALDKEARACVVAARMKRTSYRGAVDVVYGGEKPEEDNKGDKNKRKEHKQQQPRQQGGIKNKGDDNKNSERNKQQPQQHGGNKNKPDDKRSNEQRQQSPQQNGSNKRKAESPGSAGKQQLSKKAKKKKAAQERIAAELQKTETPK